MFLPKLIYHARVINLFIVALTQCIILFLLFKIPFSFSSESSDILTVNLLVLLCTLFITAGGYFINDYFDYEIDTVNKTTKHRFTKVQLLQSYFASVAVGFIITMFVCQTIGQFQYALIFIVAVGILFLYASHLKKKGLIGNVTVALFSSLVIALVWYVQHYFEITISESKINLMIFFMTFIFLSSIARELIKDCEDIKGDEKFNLTTLPIRIGLQRTNVFVSMFLACLIVVVIAWFYWIFSMTSLESKLSLLPILLLSIYILFKNIKARSKNDFASLSKMIKMLMGFGIISLSIIAYQL